MLLSNSENIFKVVINVHTIWQTLILGLIFYILCSINPSKIIMARRNINLENVGSKNLGSTNVMRNSSVPLGMLAMVLDIGKFLLAFGISYIIFKNGFSNALLAYAAIFSILGHNFSIFNKFNGGKGVSMYGTFFLVFNWQIALILVAVLLIFIAIFRVMSISVMITSTIGVIISFIPFFWLNAPFVLGEVDITWPIAVLTLWAIVMLFHFDNFKRIISNKELAIDKKKIEKIG